MIEAKAQKKMKRKIIKIDEELCNGCGNCAIACAEGALEIIDGKAKVISEIYCDGLGACIGECPQGALTIEERISLQFDEEAVERHLEIPRETSENCSENSERQCFCPSSQAMVFGDVWVDTGVMNEIPSALRQWPTKLTLVNPRAPYFKNEELIVVADCSPVAYGDFHRKILRGKPIVTVCPMLTLRDNELEKLEQILKLNPIERINLILIEVGCCQQIKLLVEPILRNLGRAVKVYETIISRDGNIICDKKQLVFD
jgi:ferredoxin